MVSKPSDKPNRTIKKLLGLPFVWGGRDTNGVDCWGLIVLYFRLRYGVEIEDPLAYCNDPREPGVDVFEDNRQSCWSLSAGSIKEGDVILFSENGNKAATHAGVMVGGGRVLQSTSATGVVAIPLRRQRGRIFRVYRHQCLD